MEHLLGPLIPSPLLLVLVPSLAFFFLLIKRLHHSTDLRRQKHDSGLSIHYSMYTFGGTRGTHGGHTGDTWGTHGGHTGDTRGTHGGHTGDTRGTHGGHTGDTRGDTRGTRDAILKPATRGDNRTFSPRHSEFLEFHGPPSTSDPATPPPPPHTLTSSSSSLSLSLSFSVSRSSSGISWVRVDTSSGGQLHLGQVQLRLGQGGGARSGAPRRPSEGRDARQKVSSQRGRCLERTNGINIQAHRS